MHKSGQCGRTSAEEKPVWPDRSGRAVDNSQNGGRNEDEDGDNDDHRQSRPKSRLDGQRRRKATVTGSGQTTTQATEPAAGRSGGGRMGLISDKMNKV